MIPATLIPLSARETTVLRLVAWGYTNKAIAVRLTISVKTVEAHKANGMRKLQLRDRSDLVGCAAKWGWLTPESSPDDDSIVRPPAAGRR